MTHSRFRKKDSQSQEIDRTYRLLSDRYGVDLVELVYGKNGFMKTKYPNGFPDFKGDVVYSEKYWDEFERWLDKERGIILSDKYSGYADSRRKRDSDRLSLRELAFALIDYAFENEENYSSNYDHGTWEDLYGLVIPVQVIPKWKKFTDDEFERVADIIENTGKVMSIEYDKDNKEFSVITRTKTWQDSKKRKTTKKDGGGAGYNIFAIDYQILSGKIIGVTQIDNDTIKVKCDLNATADVWAKGYDTNSSTYEPQIKITEIVLGNNMDDDFGNYGIIGEDGKYTGNEQAVYEFIKDSIGKIETKTLYGYGWSHVTYDGTLTTGESYKEFTVDDWYCYVSMIAKIVSLDVINDIEYEITNPYGEDEEPVEDSKHRKSHDSKPRYKTFIVKANSYQDAVEKVKRKLRK